MGANEFITHRAGADLGEAYDGAVREARAEHGNDGYNGTISTTSGVTPSTRSVMTVSGATLWADAHLDDAEKWGAALAVPTAPDDAFQLTVERFKVTLDDGDEHSWSVQHALEQKARGLAFRRHGTAVHKVEVRPKVKTKVVTVAAAGGSVLKWQSGAWKLFDTKAQAVAYAKEQLLGRQSHEAISVKQVRVWPESTFEDKTVATKVTVQTVQATADVVVTVAVPRRATVPVEGWLFFGLAAC
jgi:hypothetical protein